MGAGSEGKAKGGKRRQRDVLPLAIILASPLANFRFGYSPRPLLAPPPRPGTGRTAGEGSLFGIGSEGGPPIHPTPSAGRWLWGVPHYPGGPILFLRMAGWSRHSFFRFRAFDSDGTSPQRECAIFPRPMNVHRGDSPGFHRKGRHRASRVYFQSLCQTFPALRKRGHKKHPHPPKHATEPAPAPPGGRQRLGEPRPV